MTWAPPASGAPPAGYTLVARSAPGAAPLVTVPLGLTQSFTTTAPSGTYLVSRWRATRSAPVRNRPC
ncbi:MAG: hypothetical protein R2712_24675 [Vicinamibacterales bacterium]